MKKTGRWLSRQVIGEPKCQNETYHESSGGSWAQSEFTNCEYIEVEFKNFVYVTEINVYELSQCGCITKIKVKYFLHILLERYLRKCLSLTGPRKIRSYDLYVHTILIYALYSMK